MFPTLTISIQLCESWRKANLLIDLLTPVDNKLAITAKAAFADYVERFLEHSFVNKSLVN